MIFSDQFVSKLKRPALAVLTTCAILAAGSFAYGQLTAPMKVKGKLTVKTMLDGSTQTIVTMKVKLQDIAKLQDVARKAANIVKLNCVNDKQLQVKQLLNVADKAHTELIAATAVPGEHTDCDTDPTGACHQFSQITIAGEQVDVIANEAENCIGEDLSFLGTSEIIVEIDDGTDDTDTGDFDLWEVEIAPIPSPWV